MPGAAPGAPVGHCMIWTCTVLEVATSHAGHGEAAGGGEPGLLVLTGWSSDAASRVCSAWTSGLLDRA